MAEVFYRVGHYPNQERQKQKINPLETILISTNLAVHIHQYQETPQWIDLAAIHQIEPSLFQPLQPQSSWLPHEHLYL